MTKPVKPHKHLTRFGWVTCYHSCKNTLLSASFWLGLTLSFPLEHLLWEKVWPFKLLTTWMGL